MNILYELSSALGGAAGAMAVMTMMGECPTWGWFWGYMVPAIALSLAAGAVRKLA